MAPLVIREEMSERHHVGMDRDPVPTCKMFVRSVVVLSWLCIVCVKCMKPLSFDSPAKTDVVRRFSTSAKLFVSTLSGLKPETSCTTLTCSSHSATQASHTHTHTHTHTHKIIVNRRGNLHTKEMYTLKCNTLTGIFLCNFLCNKERL